MSQYNPNAATTSRQEKTADEDCSPFFTQQLLVSSALFRRTIEWKLRASIKDIDLSKPTPGKSSRSCLCETMMKKASAANELDI
jgi:hypothetical protein